MIYKKIEDTKILLVDDEKDFRDALAFSLKRIGYQISTASNGRDAFDLIQSNGFDVVVSDICMSGGDGIELLERTRERSSDTPIILLVTGFSELSTEEAHNKGADALFSKPFDKQVLIDTINRLLLPPEDRWSRRIAERVDAEFEVELQFESLKDAIGAKVVNIGRGGMFVTLNESNLPAINDNVAFKINFSNAQGLTGSGVVRWVRTRSNSVLLSGCGIEFSYMGDHERQLVIEFVNANKPKAFIPNK